MEIQVKYHVLKLFFSAFVEVLTQSLHTVIPLKELNSKGFQEAAFKNASGISELNAFYRTVAADLLSCFQTNLYLLSSTSTTILVTTINLHLSCSCSWVSDCLIFHHVPLEFVSNSEMPRRELLLLSAVSAMVVLRYTLF